MTAKIISYDNVSMPATTRCDRCGAQAYVEVLLPSTNTLHFCAHHYRVHGPKLREIEGATIADHTPLLEAQEQQPEPAQS